MRKVSIIIPAFNSSRSIGKTLDSLVNQTFKDFEVIIIDDCSKDVLELEALLEGYKQLDLTLLKHDVNKNGAAARNTGIKRALGEYIAFLDSDDQWENDKLEKYLCLTSEFQDDNYIFYSKIRVLKCDGSQPIERPTRPITEGEHVSDYLFVSHELIQTSTILLKTSLAKEILFDERFIRHQDYDFVIRAQDRFNAKFVFLDKALTNYTSSINAIGRSISLGESSSYSKFWLNEMKKFMTDESILHYKFFYLSKKLKSENKKTQMLCLMFLSYIKMSNKMKINDWLLNKL